MDVGDLPLRYWYAYGIISHQVVVKRYSFRQMMFNHVWFIDTTFISFHCYKISLFESVYSGVQKKTRLKNFQSYDAQLGWWNYNSLDPGNP